MMQDSAGTGRRRGGRRTRRLAAALAVARRQIAELEQLVAADPLTGVLNRRGFFVELERALAFSRRYGTGAALVYFDIDRFKAINDGLGHAAGDLALVHLAATLRANLRSSDIVGRVGGDEFVVLLWAASGDDAEKKAERLREAIEAPGGETRPDVAVSVGVTVVHGDDDPASILARADAAMYGDKARRRGDAAKD